MSEDVPALSEMLVRSKDAFDFPVTINTSKMEALLMSMFSEMQKMKGEIVVLKEELAKKADSNDVEQKLSENKQKIDEIRKSLSASIQELGESTTQNIDKALSQSLENTHSIVDNMQKNVTYVNQVIAPTEAPPISTFESTRPEPTTPPKTPEAMRPERAAKLPFDLPNRVITPESGRKNENKPQTETKEEKPEQREPTPKNEQKAEVKEEQREQTPKNEPQTEVKEEKTEQTPKNEQQQEVKEEKTEQKQNSAENEKPDYRIPTPQDCKRMTPEEASDLLANVARTSTPEETGRLAAEMSEHVKDDNIENIFINLSQKLTPRTTQKIVAEVSTYVDDTVSARILSALSSQLTREQVAEMIKEISTRIAEEETSRIVDQLTQQFQKEDAIAMVIKMCDKMTPQQTSAVVTMLAMNMTPEESRKVMDIITSKVVPEKTVSIAAEMNHRVDENEGKVTDIQMNSIKSARDAAERVSRTITANNSNAPTPVLSPKEPREEAKEIPQKEEAKEVPQKEEAKEVPQKEEVKQVQSPATKSPKPELEKLNLDDSDVRNLAERIDIVERSIRDLSAIVTDLRNDSSELDSKREGILNIIENAPRETSSSDSQKRKPPIPEGGTKLSSRQDSSRKALKETLDHIFTEKNTERVDEEEDAKENENKPKSENVAASSPPPAMINTDELLDQFLDVAHAELEQTRHEITEDTQKVVKGMETILRQMITKVSASQDVGQKKVNSQIAELTTKLNIDITSTRNQSKGDFDQMKVTLAQINERLSVTDKRLDDISAASKVPPPIQKIKLGEDGLLDMQPIIEQINGQNALVTDINSRLGHLEKKEYVHPTAFQQSVQRIDAVEEKFNDVNKRINSATDLATETKQSLQDYINLQESEEGQRKFKEINERFDANEAEIKKLVEGNVKMNKDLTGARAAINTLRSYSEETTGAVGQIQSMVDNVREESQMIDKRTKRSVQEVQTKVDSEDEKIKDVSRSIERTDDKVDEITQKIAELQNKVTELSEISERGMPRSSSISTVNRPTSPIPDVEPVVSGVFKSSSSLELAKESMLFPTAPQATNADNAESSTAVTVPSASNIPISFQQLPEYNEIQQQFHQLQQQQLQLEASMTNSNNMKNSKGSKRSVIKETVISSVDQKKFAEITAKIIALQSSLSTEKATINSMQKNIEILHDIKAEKDELKAIFEQFRIAMGELNSRIISVRKSVNSKVDQSQIEEIIKMMPKAEEHEELDTSAAEVRCLLCGCVRKPNKENAPPEKEEHRPIIKENSGEQCFLYGDGGEMFLGRSSNGKPVVSKHATILAPLQPPKK